MPRQSLSESAKKSLHSFTAGEGAATTSGTKEDLTMPAQQTAPYGSWKSPITSDDRGSRVGLGKSYSMVKMSIGAKRDRPKVDVM
jgi:hypothetical protein